MTAMLFRTAAGFALLLAVIAAPCSAQRGGFRAPNSRTPDSSILHRHVVLEHARELTGPVMTLVSNELGLTFGKTVQDKSTGDFLSITLGPPYGVEFGTVDVDQSLMIRSLNVVIHMPDDQYDEALLEKRWDEGRQKLQGALRSAQRTITRQREDSRIAALQTLANRRRRLEAELAAVIDELERNGGAAGSPDQLRDQLNETMSMLRELELDGVSVEARRRAIEERIDELRKQAEVAAESDPMIAELLKIQEIRERQLDNVRTRFASGQTSAGEVAQAETDMAHARIDLLKAQRAASEQASGGVLRELNNELSNLIVRLAEIDARTSSLEKIAHDLQKETSFIATARRSALELKLAMLLDAIARLNAKQTELDGEETTVDESISITPLDESLGLGIEEEAEKTP